MSEDGTKRRIDLMLVVKWDIGASKTDGVELVAAGFGHGNRLPIATEPFSSHASQLQLNA